MTVNPIYRPDNTEVDVGDRRPNSNAGVIVKIQTILGRSARSRDAYWCELDHLSRFQRKKKDSFCERGAFVIGRLLLALQVLGILGSPQRKHNLKESVH